MKLIKINDRNYQAASHENQNNPGVLKKIIVERKDFFDRGRPQMINWAKLPAGNSFAPHYHEDMQEVFIIIKGSPIMEIEREKFILDEGDTMVVDVNEIHIMRNNTNEDIEYIVIGISGDKNGKTMIVNRA